MCQNSSPQTSTFVTERDQAFLNLAAAWRLYADKAQQEFPGEVYAVNFMASQLAMRACADMLERVVRTGSSLTLEELRISLTPQ